MALLVARKFAIIGLACGLVISAGCKRNKTVNQAQNGAPVNGADGVAGGTAEARALLEKGKELYRDDEDSKAAEAFQEAIKLDPNLAEAHFRLGLSYEALQKAEESEAAYKKAVDVYKVYLTDNPKDAEAHYNLGQTYAALHLYSDAVREYKQATRLKEDDSDVYCDLGMALTRLAQYDEAAGAFSKSLEIDPENYRAQDGLEEARQGVSRIKAAKKHQEDVLKKQKEDELKKQQEGSSPSQSPETKTGATLKENQLATYTPPPYFPQGSLSPPDAKRYRKFKLIIALVVLGLLGLLTTLGIGVVYLLKRAV